MLFNSIGFLFFLPATVMVYYLLPAKFRWMLLLAVSYLFYFLWKAEFVLVLMTATLASYYAALKMGGIREKRRRRGYLWLVLLINLGMLAVFKYSGFFAELVNLTGRIGGKENLIPAFSLLLPVGISFYTFQTVGYTIDVYRGVVQPEQNAGRYALFVSFFPLVLAGPIERGKHLLPQLRMQHAFDPDLFTSGLRLILWGFFKKIVIADRLLMLVQPVIERPSYFHGVEIGFAVVLKLMQVYADFSGYTDIAIGSARLFGIRLNPNFNRPFSAQSVAGFWSRWHISLTSWLRDYVYFSLPSRSGGKTASWRLNLNLLITFILVGFWHGPYWNFIIFGFLHGTLMILANVFKPAMLRFNQVSRLNRAPRLLKGLNISATFLLVCTTGVFFGQHSTSDSLLMIRNFGDFSHTLRSLFQLLRNNDFTLGVFLVIFMLWFETKTARKDFIERFLAKPIAVRFSAYLFMLFFLLVFGVFSSQKFVYFQF